MALCETLVSSVYVQEQDLWIVGSNRGDLYSYTGELVLEPTACHVAAGWKKLAQVESAAFTRLREIQGAFWALGHQELRLRSQAGQVWSVDKHRPSSPQAWLDIAAKDASSERYAVGTRGLFAVSYDAGQHWESGPIFIDPEWEEADDYTLHTVVSLKGGAMLVAGELGVVYRSHNGTDWQRDDSERNATWFAAVALKEGGALLVGFSGAVAYLKHPDAELVHLASGVSESLFAVEQNLDGSVFMAGAGGLVLRWHPAEPGYFERLSTTSQATITDIDFYGEALILTSNAGLQRLSLPRVN